MKRLFIAFVLIIFVLLHVGQGRAENPIQESLFGTVGAWGLDSTDTLFTIRFGAQSNTSKTWNARVLETANVTYLSELGAYYSMKGVTYCDGSNGLGCLGAALVARDIGSGAYERLVAYPENQTSITPAAGNTYLATHSLQWLYNGTSLVPQRQDVYAGAGTAAVREKGFSSTNITTNASTVVKASAGRLQRLIVGVAGTATTVAIYNDATSPCDTNLLGTINTAAEKQVDMDINAATGICLLTAGTTAANIMAVWE